MRNRRFAVIAALAVVEIWIIGLMVRSVVGGGSHRPSFGSGATPTSFVAAAQAAGAPFEQTLITGPQPHVVIDDDSALISVNVRPGVTVSVLQHISAHGWTSVSEHRSSVEKTADGVEIRAPRGMTLFGSFERRMDLIVPPGTRLEVENGASIAVAGLRGDASLKSDDGSISVRDHIGSLTMKTDDGRIDLADVDAPSLVAHTSDGRIVLAGVRSDAVVLVTGDGNIDVSRSRLRGGKISTGDGRIGLALDPQSDVTVSATTSSGKVVATSPLSATKSNSDDDAPALIRIGSGAGQLKVGSDDGSITVVAGG